MYAGLNAQLYQWSCSPLNPTSNLHFLPDLLSTLFLPLDSELFGLSDPDEIYVFPVPSMLNCSGRVSEIRYCYQQNVLTDNNIIFTLLILEQSGSNFRVTNEIAVRESTPPQGCENFCCDAMTFNTEDSFPLPASNFAFGVISRALWAIRSSSGQYLVEHYRFVAPLTGSTLSGGIRATNRALRLLEFGIGKDTEIKMSYYYYCTLDWKVCDLWRSQCTHQ